MARIRTIKPEFWEDEALSTIPIQARLLFIGTWNFADDQGVLLSSVKFIKSKIFPYEESLREHQVKTWLDALVNARMLIPFNFEEKSYYYIRTFKSHQLIDKRYTKFIVPTNIVTEILARLDIQQNTTLTHSEHIVNTNSNSKVSVNVKEKDKEKIEFVSKVFLTEKEKEKVLIEFGEDSDLALTILSNYKNSSGKKYASDYHALIGWVKDKILKEKNSAKKENGKQFIGTKSGQQHPLQSLADLANGVLQGYTSQNGEGGTTP